MKKSMSVLLFCSIPWAFLAMYGDAEYGWSWPYLMPFVCMAAAALLGKEQGKFLLAGNCLSLCIAVLLCVLSGFTGQNDYFKPFGAVGWTGVLILASGLVQWLVWKREWIVLGLLALVTGMLLGAMYWLQF